MNAIVQASIQVHLESYYDQRNDHTFVIHELIFVLSHALQAP